MTSTTRSRGSYHHGDLANALTRAASDLARAGGPDAVVLREAARRVGVSATAAYRHFAGHGDLIEAVKLACQHELVGRMQEELDSGTPDPDPGREAVRKLRALGHGYIVFALDEPGLFRTCFCQPNHAASDTPAAEQAGLLEAPAFRELIARLDELVELRLLAPSRRPYAEVVAWSHVHGLAMLLLDSPLRMMPPPEREAAIARALDASIVGVLGYDPA